MVINHHEIKYTLIIGEIQKTRKDAVVKCVHMWTLFAYNFPTRRDRIWTDTHIFFVKYTYVLVGYGLDSDISDTNMDLDSLDTDMNLDIWSTKLMQVSN
jgi:hypothetical protein